MAGSMGMGIRVHGHAWAFECMGIRAGSMGIRVHCYADDTQLYISGSERDAASTMSKITDCIDAISLSMSSNRLKLNGDKSQFIWLGSRQQLAKISKDNLVIQGAEISPLDSVPDLSSSIAS